MDHNVHDGIVTSLVNAKFQYINVDNKNCQQNIGFNAL